ncbi:wiskott-Aldrich syndrome protein homolog 1-like [Melopsittacus undulatus]|uniref:wiskott-Aldrich syndrome protein homolog 1-like n=1 Tax=Melopsittacus undulatus TaxID=13146 RepID=UPI00146E7620|nr:wiskott-Aldrich syndrome protein homolog 1-like [Melopsittacus undulatus]
MGPGAGCALPCPRPAGRPEEQAPRRGRPAPPATLRGGSGARPRRRLPRRRWERGEAQHSRLNLALPLPSAPARGRGKRNPRRPEPALTSALSVAAGRPDGRCVYGGGSPCGACPTAPAPVTGRSGRRVPQGKSSGRRRGRAPAAYRPLVAAAAASHQVEARPPLPLRGRAAGGGRYSRGEPAPPLAASLRSRGRSAAAPPPQPRSSCACREPRSGRSGAVTRSPAGNPPSPPPPPPPSAAGSPQLQPRRGARSACPVTPRTAAPAAAASGAPTRALFSSSPPSPARGRQRRAQREGR